MMGKKPRARRLKALERSILERTQKYRVNFENRAQMNEYLDCYAFCKDQLKREYTPQERTIIILTTAFGWGRKKIHRRTRPQISERQVEKLLNLLPFLRQLKRFIQQDCWPKYTDAVHMITASLDLDGNVARKEVEN
jgi:hypothetical protein